MFVGLVEFCREVCCRLGNSCREVYCRLELPGLCLLEL